MPSFIDPKRLKPHPANTLFDPLPEAVYEALKEDIAAHGIHDALLVTPDFTLITGHHRAKAALELGLEAVPVEIQDVDAAEAERLLIADNVLRRQLTPMEQARLIRRLKEAYGIRQGARVDVHKTSDIMSEVQEALGLTDRHLRRLDRLNDLIPELQALVAQGRLGTAVGN
ncbi:MAG: ParB/RepB/Spo0J family partition protein [Firmicutes bacterium]|nr:ParB N-terminal domain-containing protein [Alicyclobacillaceae bacterium]MCL6497020.1 ParB/RepB/Spo0J family partition protein [Bacillota bacterium]